MSISGCVPAITKRLNNFLATCTIQNTNNKYTYTRTAKGKVKAHTSGMWLEPKYPHYYPGPDSDNGHQ